ncbi:MAG: transcriptional repressor [Rhizobiales bacterium]|nr:transcriptional repressor [Hyphomicrobiales bacterium]
MLPSAPSVITLGPEPCGTARSVTTTEFTKNQKLVFAALERAGTPLSAYQILDQLRDEGFRAPLQVYRALDQLRGLGVVHRLESMNAFVACAHADGHVHHDGEPIGFTICERCGTVSEIHDADFRAFVDGISARSGFRPEKTTVEIRGLCANCAKAA